MQPLPSLAALRSARWLVVCLRLLGTIDLCALIAVVMPREWMSAVHAWAELGEMPEAPIVGYLARSTSALYALHGLLVLYMSFDVEYYARLIRVFAAVAVLHGLIMFGIDLREGMPLWWTLAEGPIFSATGLFVLTALARAGLPRSSGQRSG